MKTKQTASTKVTATRYFSNEELFQQKLTIARNMTTREIKIALQQRNAMHSWAVRALEQVLAEKAGQ